VGERALAREEYGWEYRLVSGTCNIPQFHAATIPGSCRLFQVVAVRRRHSDKTFNPKVGGSNPPRPIRKTLETGFSSKAHMPRDQAGSAHGQRMNPLGREMADAAVAPRGCSSSSPRSTHGRRSTTTSSGRDPARQRAWSSITRGASTTASRWCTTRSRRRVRAREDRLRSSPKHRAI